MKHHVLFRLTVIASPSHQLLYLEITSMASRVKPNMVVLLQQLDAGDMLFDVFTFPQSDIVADAYEKHVNDTIREVEKYCGREGFILPLSKARDLFIVHCHLRFLCNYLFDEEMKSQWQKEGDSYKEQWTTLYESKGYPKTIGNLFDSASELEAENLPVLLDDAKMPESNFSPENPMFTIFWHLHCLCNSLPDGSERKKWESRRSQYLLSEWDHREASRAAEAVMQFKKALEEFELQERGMEFDEYYNNHVVSTRKKQVRKSRKKEILRSLEDRAMQIR